MNSSQHVIVIDDGWGAALDVLEARLARQEAALANNTVDGSFQALALPSVPPNEGERMRAELALQRVLRLEERMRALHERAVAPRRQSPYG